MAIDNKKNGQNRCPKCGATEINLVPSTGKLRCAYCRGEWDGEMANAYGGVEDLTSHNVGSGAVDIIPSEDDILTFKCPSCGAEVSINTAEATSARCMWCRHRFSINEKIPNGAIPDLVLPFKLEKANAEANIRAFVDKRQFFAHPVFKKEFTTENVMGVYMPYMIVDAKAHLVMKGEAEHLIRTYLVGSKNKTRYYDAEAYRVERDFDLLVDDLTVESSTNRLDQDIRSNTNNVINAIMPFDTENCVAYNAAFMAGYSSEKRDTNVDQLKTIVATQVGDVARYKVKESMTYYDRGARWENEDLKISGSKWVSAYLPVWLYSYMQDENGQKMLHYVAVNARTGETMGSVPVNKSRLLVVSTIIEILGIVLGFLWIYMCLKGASSSDDDNPWILGLVGLTPGFIFYWLKMSKYRNMDKRHGYEKETKSEIKNLKAKDDFIERRNRLRNSRIAGENDNAVKGVIAKNGKEMMGEKMANYLGIGRSVDSKASQTEVGQAVESEAKGKFGF